ncbi:MAG: hypothetical protein ABIN74_02075 [Ferruginibacter sp.]
MNKYLKTTGICLGMWLIASVLNGLLSGISLLQGFVSSFRNKIKTNE